MRQLYAPFRALLLIYHLQMWCMCMWSNTAPFKIVIAGKHPLSSFGNPPAKIRYSSFVRVCRHCTCVIGRHCTLSAAGSGDVFFFVLFFCFFVFVCVFFLLFL